MPELQKEVSVLFKAKSDDADLLAFLKNMQGAQVQISAAGEKAREAGQKAQEGAGGFSQLKDTLAGLATAWISFEGLKKAGEFFLDAAKGAYEEERVLKSLTLLTHQFDKTETDATGKIKEFVDAMVKQGVQSEVTLGGLRTLIPVSGDLGNAIRGAKLATDISSAGLMDYGSALDLVRGLIAGSDRGVMQAHKQLGIEAKTADGALKEMYGKFGGYTEKLDDNKKAVDRFKASWGDFKTSIGEGVISLMQKMGDKLKYLADMIIYGKEAADFKAGSKEQEASEQKKREAREQELKTNIAQMEKAKAATKEGSEAWKEYDYYIGRSTEELKKLQEQNKKAADTEGAPEVNPALAKDGKGDDKAAAAAKAQTQAMLDLAKSVEDLRRAETAEAQAALESADGKAALNAAARNVSIALDAELAAARKALEVEKSKAVQEAQLAGASGKTIEDIKKTFANRDLLLVNQTEAKKYALTMAWARKQETIDTSILKFEKATEDKKFQQAKAAADKYQAMLDAAGKKTTKSLAKMNADQLRNYVQNLQEKIDAAKEAGLETLEFEKQLSDAKIQLAKMEAQLKMEANLGVVSGIIGSLGTMFKAQKAAAVAQGLINAYLAATNAGTKGDPYTTALRVAAALIACMAQVMAMQSVEIGSGSSGGGGAGGGASGGGSGYSIGESHPTVGGYRPPGGSWGGAAGAGGYQDNRNTYHGPSIHWSPMLLTRTDAEKGFRMIERRLITAKVQNKRGRLGGNKRYGGKVGYRGRT